MVHIFRMARAWNNMSASREKTISSLASVSRVVAYNIGRIENRVLILRTLFSFGCDAEDVDARFFYLLILVSIVEVLLH